MVTDMQPLLNRIGALPTIPTNVLVLTKVFYQKYPRYAQSNRIVYFCYLTLYLVCWNRIIIWILSRFIFPIKFTQINQDYLLEHPRTHMALRSLKLLSKDLDWAYHQMWRLLRWRSCRFWHRSWLWTNHVALQPQWLRVQQRTFSIRPWVGWSMILGQFTCFSRTLPMLKSPSVIWFK